VGGSGSEGSGFPGLEGFEGGGGGFPVGESGLESRFEEVVGAEVLGGGLTLFKEGFVSHFRFHGGDFFLGFVDCPFEGLELFLERGDAGKALRLQSASLFGIERVGVFAGEAFGGVDAFLVDFPEVVVEISREEAAFAWLYFEDAVDDGIEEVAVVGDDEVGALVGHERSLKDSFAGDIEVIGGFVEDEEIGGLEQEAGKGKAVFFSTGEDVNRLIPIRFREKKGSKDGADVSGGVKVGDVGSDFQDRLLRVKFIGLVLCEIADIDLVAEVDCPCGRFFPVGEEAGEGGFAGSIDADDADAVPLFQLEGEMAEHFQVTVGLVEAISFDDGVAALAGERKDELNGLGGGLGFDADHFIELFDAALDLGGLGGLGAEALDETLGLGNFAVLAFFGRFEHFATLLLLVEKGRVVAGVVDDLAAFDGEDLVAKLVDEGLIVRDQEKGAWVRAEESFEPANGVEVKVVGGLIHHEQVRLLKQKAGEGDAHLPSTGEGFAGLLKTAAGKSQPKKNFFRLGAQFMGFQGFQLLGAVRVAVKAFPVGGCFGVEGEQLLAGQFQLMLQELDISGGSLHFFDDAVIFEDDAILWQVAQATVFAAVDFNGVRFAEIKDELEEGGFAASVGADQGDSAARVELQAGVVEERFGPVGKGQFSDRKQHGESVCDAGGGWQWTKRTFLYHPASLDSRRWQSRWSEGRIF
jgi:hypothetical protein